MTHSSGDKQTEYCKDCECETTHLVSIDIIQESDNASTEVYSREPYRISQCANCERTEQLRMNKICADGEIDVGSIPSLDNLSAQERETLHAVYANPGATQKEIGEILDLVRQTVQKRLNNVDGFEWNNRDAFVTRLFDDISSPPAPNKPDIESREWLR